MSRVIRCIEGSFSSNLRTLMDKSNNFINFLSLAYAYQNSYSNSSTSQKVAYREKNIVKSIVI